MRVILVPTADKPECIVALENAFSLGKLFKSHVIGCHIQAHKESDEKAEHKPNNDQLLDSNTEKKSLDAKNTFMKLAQSHSYKVKNKTKTKACAMWVKKYGTTSKVFSIIGPVSDLIVVSRPAKQGTSIAKDFMISAVMNSARPVIILPQLESPKIGEVISIAWNQSKQAAQAVSASMPLLKRARKVNIIGVSEENKLGPKSSHLMKYLKSWGIKSEKIIGTGKNDSKAILNAYHQSQSDLLIMGGYSRSQLSQRLFGGVTQHMLFNADVPVFMLHSG